MVHRRAILLSSNLAKYYMPMLLGCDFLQASILDIYVAITFLHFVCWYLLSL
ncbi:hypothetical protein CNEO4_210029 [Clostridium neonatale]|nr:hypothetical protein CNEO2_130029 [Clostridium neonatale]CAI3202595.1 hypothetical protein CNEO2_260029 [Clostridium neonatale]CAI3593650.1 hypothetical protein CNEO4_210029 [Clostridium neonatale]